MLTSPIPKPVSVIVSLSGLLLLGGCGADSASDPGPNAVALNTPVNPFVSPEGSGAQDVDDTAVTDEPAFVSAEPSPQQDPDQKSAQTASPADAGDCGGCLFDPLLTLSWEPNPEPSVNGYKIYFGSSPDNVGIWEDVSVAQPGFDAVSPQVQYRALTDLRIQEGDNICFRITAYDNTIESDPSDAVCTTV
jgi:hypothetical protein